MRHTNCAQFVADLAQKVREIFGGIVDFIYICRVKIHLNRCPGSSLPKRATAKVAKIH